MLTTFDAWSLETLDLGAISGGSDGIVYSDVISQIEMFPQILFVRLIMTI